ncbi:MAG: hypothetical protein ACOCYE_14335, partial [Pseudomonadota bacterium]
MGFVLAALAALGACTQAAPPPAVTGPAVEVSRDVGPYSQALSDGRYAVAVAGLRSVVQAHPDHTEAKLLL